MSDITQSLRMLGLMHSLPTGVDQVATAAADEIDRLTRELANAQAADVHSCHANCTRAGCVTARLRAELLREHQDHKQTVEDAATVLAENRALREALERLIAAYSVSHSPAVRQSVWEQARAALKGADK